MTRYVVARMRSPLFAPCVTLAVFRGLTVTRLR